MPDIRRIIVLIVLTLLIAACSPTAAPTPARSVLPTPQISRYPKPMDLSEDNPPLTSIPKFDPNSTNLWQIDLRSQDLTKIDMTGSLTDLRYAIFDTKTQWPEADKLPAGFDWQKIMENGKDPGLGIRALHAQGVTGKGVSIAIIDLVLLVDHVEYKDRIRLYEEAEDVANHQVEADLHGPAVASIFAGHTVGVAPEADLYYIGSGYCGVTSMADFDYSCVAKSVKRIVEINKSLPADRKIRVLSMSFGWLPQSKGSEEITAAVEEAKAAGIFAVSVNVQQTYGWDIWGLGRNPLSDPNDFESYEPASWWKAKFFKSGLPANSILVPMDSRTLASPTGAEDYAFYRQGGISWAIPYLAGMYALAIQVEPGITPEEFWATALETGRTIQIQHDGKDYDFGVILDPQALIEALKSK